jgi:hypothetical protein
MHLLPCTLARARPTVQSRDINTLNAYILRDANATLAALNATGVATNVTGKLTLSVAKLTNPAAAGVVSPFDVLALASHVNATFFANGTAKA